MFAPKCPLRPSPAWLPPSNAEWWAALRFISSTQSLVVVRHHSVPPTARIFLRMLLRNPSPTSLRHTGETNCFSAARFRIKARPSSSTSRCPSSMFRAINSVSCSKKGYAVSWAGCECATEVLMGTSLFPSGNFAEATERARLPARRWFDAER